MVGVQGNARLIQNQRQASCVGYFTPSASKLHPLRIFLTKYDNQSSKLIKLSVLIKKVCCFIGPT